MSFINKFWIKFFAREIGADQFGNKYFIGKKKII
jgi:NADH:ubiquinone oxidoreductase subunit